VKITELIEKLADVRQQCGNITVVVGEDEDCCKLVRGLDPRGYLCGNFWYHSDELLDEEDMREYEHVVLIYT